MTEQILCAHEEKEESDWSDSVMKFEKRWDLAEKSLTKCLLIRCGMLLVKLAWMMVHEASRKEI